MLNYGCGIPSIYMVPEAIFEKLEPMLVKVLRGETPLEANAK